MITKKQLAALAYGRAVRRANIKKRKTTNASYKCKSSKKKTKANFDEIMAEAEKVVGDSAPINVDGNMVDINFEDYVPKHKPTLWEKTKKFVVGAATAAALGGLGYYGLKKAGIIDWKPLEKKLERMGASAKDIAGVRHALVEDTEEERKKKAAEREKINHSDQTETTPWYQRWGTAMDTLNDWTRPKSMDTLDSRYGESWKQNKRFFNHFKKDPKYNNIQQRFYNIIERMDKNFYDVDLNQVSNILNEVGNDILRYDFDNEFLPTDVIGKIQSFNTFPAEYEQNVSKYAPKRFKHWMIGKIGELTKIFEKYHKITHSKNLK